MVKNYINERFPVVCIFVTFAHLVMQKILQRVIVRKVEIPVKALKVCQAIAPSRSALPCLEGGDCRNTQHTIALRLMRLANPNAQNKVV
jgi:hypothetical protein